MKDFFGSNNESSNRKDFKKMEMQFEAALSNYKKSVKGSNDALKQYQESNERSMRQFVEFLK